MNFLSQNFYYRPLTHIAIYLVIKTTFNTKSNTNFNHIYLISNTARRSTSSCVFPCTTRSSWDSSRGSPPSSCSYGTRSSILHLWRSCTSSWESSGTVSPWSGRSTAASGRACTAWSTACWFPSLTRRSRRTVVLCVCW